MLSPLRTRLRTFATAWLPGFALAGLLTSPAAAQAPDWAAAAGAAVPQNAGNPAQVLSTASDGAGNLYLAGTFRGTAQFGSTTLTSAGGSDAFVAKWNGATNTFAWVQRLGGSGNDTGEKLAANGPNIYLAGTFTGTTTLGTASYVASGLLDGYVVKLTDAGSSAQVLWSQTIASQPQRSNIPGGLAVSGANVYLTGTFGGNPNFGGTVLTSPSTNGFDLYVAKLTDAGNSGAFTWLQSAGGEGGEGSAGIAVNGANVYVVGYYTSPQVAFGSTTLSNSGSSGNTADGFITKLTDAGNSGAFTWTQRVSGTGEEALRGVAVSGANVYLAGYYNSANVVVAGLPALTNAGGLDLLVAKLVDAGPSGSFTWAARAGGAGNEAAGGLAVAGSTLFLTGSFQSTVAFGATVLTSAGSDDVFLARLTDTGSAPSFGYALRGGGTSSEFGADVEVSGPTVYVGGTIFGPATFGATTLPAPGGTTASGFVAALTDQTLATASPALSAALALYPTPARHSVAVQLTGLTSAAPATLTLLDALGRPVRTAPYAPVDGVHQLPLHGLRAGHYHLLVQAGTQRTTRALLIE